ncbi:rubrerythrin family protein [Occallatibacter savannae]|uniref:rubrerythrin family protein n=1 Tax=Occallatibacter savannae TaxID=1002691 RepID=UPI000D68B8FA|nr:rubrerythrin family protein [Occallatibacter savannae]
MTRRHPIISGFFSSVAIFAIAGAVLACAPVWATTIENLQTAYNGESNAHARYLAFAKQADKEGYGEVASLFRAAARAEEVHAMNHSAVIGELGGVAKADVQEPVVKTTRENLEEAIKGESYERDTMYPGFLKQARSDHNTGAIRTLNLAKSAESEHARLFAASLSNLEKLKGSKSVTHYVCPTCGFTARETNFKECPSCFTSKNKFEKVA